MNKNWIVVRHARTLSLTLLLSTMAACEKPTDALPDQSANPGQPSNFMVPELDLPELSELDNSPNANEVAPFRFHDIATESGISFVARSGYNNQKHFPTSLGSGVAMLDYDLDGRIDLYMATTRDLPFSVPANTTGNRLFRNLGNGKFVDVTSKADVGYTGFCHGVVAADFNSDGFADLLLTNLGDNVLYLNNGDGSFRVAESTGLEGIPWSSAAAPIDLDSDGNLDVYISSYAVWSLESELPCYGDPSRRIRILCTPFSLTPIRHHLFRNRGNGTFDDITESAGILRSDGRGLGVIAGDIDLDGKTDLYVANDGCPNFLFRNLGDGQFEDLTDLSGAAVDARGEVQGSMGVDLEDIDSDGLPELLATNFRGQYNTLYRNLDGRYFVDSTARSGTVKDSQLWVGWGTAYADLDNDTRPDLVVVNGEVDDNLHELGQDISFAQPAYLWRNQGDFQFQRVQGAGPFFDEQTHPARGLAMGDLDDDGDLDMVVSIMDRPAALLQNEAPPRSWLRIDLLPRASNRTAIGTVIRVGLGDQILTRQLKGGGSYLSSNDPRLLVGLGNAGQADWIEIRWPSGTIDRLDAIASGQTIKVLEGQHPISSEDTP